MDGLMDGLDVEMRRNDLNRLGDWRRGRGPVAQRREGEVGVGERSGIPHLTPTLSAPRGGEGVKGGRDWSLRVRSFPQAGGERPGVPVEGRHACPLVGWRLAGKAPDALRDFDGKALAPRELGVLRDKSSVGAL